MHARNHCLTLHLDQFGHVCAEQGINPLRLAVSIYVQLDVCREATENRCIQENERVETKDRMPESFRQIYVPSAGRTPSGCVCWQLAAEPVAVEVGWRVVGAQAFAVALADFGQDVDPVASLHTVVGLDVEGALWLNNLEHLEKGNRDRKWGENLNICRSDLGQVLKAAKISRGLLCGVLTFFILKDSSSSLSTARMFSMGMLHRAPSPGGQRKHIRHEKWVSVIKVCGCIPIPH